MNAQEEKGERLQQVVLAVQGQDEYDMACSGNHVRLQGGIDRGDELRPSLGGLSMLKTSI